MENSDIEAKVSSHYTSGNVLDRILSALSLTDAVPGSISIDQLFPVDQLHHGGVGLTEKMATLARVSSDSAVLDAGSGIGGSSRFLTNRIGCKVHAIDLSNEFVAVAKRLDDLVGLKDQIEHRVGSVTDLPYESNMFDVVWCQNVTMNVADKSAMFAQAHRVLRPGGTYVLSHIGARLNADPEFPVPWAMSKETSFTTQPSEFLDALKHAGFCDVVDHAKNSPSAPPPPNADGQPDDSVTMGDDMPQRRKNAAKAIAAGDLIPMLVTAQA